MHESLLSLIQLKFTKCNSNCHNNYFQSHGVAYIMFIKCSLYILLPSTPATILHEYSSSVEYMYVCVCVCVCVRVCVYVCVHYKSQ